jgi:transposase-like protein
MHQNYPSDSTVYEWITKYSDHAVKHAIQYKPNVGDVWVADETMLSIDGKKVWFWDIIDAKTRFLLASHISIKRTTTDANTLMRKAQIKAGKKPKIVLTDKLAAYFGGIEKAFGGDTKHYASKGFKSPTNTNLIERFHSTLKQRTKVMRGLKDTESARLITRAWLIHYNYFRPHEGIDGLTPSQKAGILSKQRNWYDVVKSTHIVKPVNIPVERMSLRISPKPLESLLNSKDFPSTAKAIYLCF